jgi:glycosyltransferase involved in cell wall biosynthesis
LKILFLKEQRSASGIEGVSSYLFNVCKELDCLNIEYLVLYNAKDIFYQKMIEGNINVQIFEYPSNSFVNMFRLFKINKTQEGLHAIVKKENITHINVHFPYLLQFVKTEWRVPVIAHWHGAFETNAAIKFFYFKDVFSIRAVLNNFYRKYRLFNFDKADIVICAGQAAKNTAIYKFLVNKQKIILNMYGTPEIKIDEIKDIRQLLKVKKDHKLIISVGRETKAKGVEDFCKVAVKLCARNYKFIYLGGHRDQTYHDYLVKTYGDFVDFVGMKENVDEYYKAADLMLFLSHRESAPTVIFESMAFSLPIVGWDTVGVNELIINDYNGYCCPFTKINYVADKVEFILENNEVNKRISNNSHKSFQDNYIFKKHVQRLLFSFKSLKGGN